MSSGDLSAADLKGKGNTAFRAQDHTKAIECYTAAIERSPDDHVLYSNRCACHAALKVLALSPSSWAHQVPALFSAPKLTDVYRKPSMST